LLRDGQLWKGIERQTDVKAFDGHYVTASFAVLQREDVQFIRVTGGGNCLRLAMHDPGLK
jgi:hypothetical protein